MQGIYRAARDCDVDALRGELLAGVSPDLISENCGSAFHIVCSSDPSREQVACCNLLIEHGASVHVRDNVGNTALHFASHNVEDRRVRVPCGVLLVLIVTIGLGFPEQDVRHWGHVGYY